MKNAFFGSALILAMASFSSGEAHAQAGLLGSRTDLEPLTLASGQPLAREAYELESGKYYRIDIEADGSAELAIAGPEFFRNIWVDEVIINDIEVRPLASTASSSTMRARPRSRS